MPRLSPSTPADRARRVAARYTEQAITLSLLEVPMFRRKAGLPPRFGGDSLAVCGRVLGLSREAVRLIELRALRKLRAACCSDPELRQALTHLFNK